VKPEEEVYTYESARRRDPFYSLISAAKAAEKKKKKFASPLEEYDVYQMKLIAVVRNSNRYALVRLPDGKHYTLREGSVVGIHGGRVSRIDPNSLVVEETISDMKGKSYPKQITLKLREEEE
jgi:Tfp pilus assembly protein PilP